MMSTGQTRRYRTAWLPALLTCTLLSCFEGALAQTVKPPPLRIGADSLVHNEKTRRSVFDGNVVLNNGKLKIEADRIELKRDANNHASGTAFGRKGKQAKVTGKVASTGANLLGTADSIDFNSLNQAVIMRGNAVLLKTLGEESDSVQGEVVRVNMLNEEFRAEGGRDGRVELLLTPR